MYSPLNTQPTNYKNRTTSSSKSSSTFSSKTMEEVWKDITLHCPHGHNSTNMNFQDFLARPYSNKDTPSQPANMQPHAATALSLNASHPHHLHFLDNTRVNLDTRAMSNVSTLTNPLEALSFASGVPAYLRKRMSSESDSSSGDRRHKRMIKNRESAARSRARKQAYTSQLEHELSQLAEENATLKKQQEQLMYTAAYLPKKHKLHRTLTAPF